MWVWCHARHNSWPFCVREGLVENLVPRCALTAVWVLGTPHSCETRERSLLFSSAWIGAGAGRKGGLEKILKVEKLLCLPGSGP